MIKKTTGIISKIVLIIALLNIFAWSVYQSFEGNKDLGIAAYYLKEFSKFPDLVMNVSQEIISPERMLDVGSGSEQGKKDNFEESNNLDYDIYAINGFFDQQKWVIQLSNLKNDSVIHEWYLTEKDFIYTGREFSHSDPRSPIILKDKSIIIHNDESYNLYRIGPDSKILWHNTDYQYHHSINKDFAGNIWACGRKYVQYSKPNIEYYDNSIINIDFKTGKTIFHKSLSQIFVENDLGYLVHGFSNQVDRVGDDPLHLNEIEPVLENGEYWKKGDLFLSLRNRSAILLYRPSTNKVIRIINGPFYHHHDIDIMSDSTISIFNNNVSGLQTVKKLITKPTSDSLIPNSNLNAIAEVLVYNLNDSSYSSLYPNQFEQNNIYTRTEGLHQLLSNGDLFIESQNEGKVFIFNKDKTLLKKYFIPPINGKTERPHWVRLYENLDFLN